MTEQVDKHDQLLLLLVSNLQQTALVQLGKLADPVTGRTGVDLEASRLTIDLLDMLRVKCRAGTPEAIVRELDRIVMDLQLNFTDVAAKEGRGHQSGDDEGPGAPERESPDEQAAAAAPEGEPAPRDEATSGADADDGTEA